MKEIKQAVTKTLINRLEKLTGFEFDCDEDPDDKEKLFGMVHFKGINDYLCTVAFTHFSIDSSLDFNQFYLNDTPVLEIFG